MGRIIALDYGTKRIGVAVTDETKTISMPKPYFFSAEKDKLIEFIKENEVEEILLGLPVGMGGQETESTAKARGFARWLEDETGLPVKLIDERLTSKEIMRGERDREKVDSLVAQKMLERYIENKKNAQGNPS